MSHLLCFFILLFFFSSSINNIMYVVGTFHNQKITSFHEPIIVCSIKLDNLYFTPYNKEKNFVLLNALFIFIYQELLIRH